MTGATPPQSPIEAEISILEGDISRLLGEVTKAEAAKEKAEADYKKLSHFLDPTSDADRRLFYEKVKGRRLPGGWQDCIYAPQPGSTWTYGFSAYPDSNAVVIHQTDYEHYLKNDGDPGRSSDGYYIHEFTFSDPNALIVGVEIVSDWGKDHNGSWRAGSQFLLKTGGNVTVSSEYSRGTNWRCRWFYVDAKDYQFTS